VEIEFPIEFLIRGTPVSAQTNSARGRERWKQTVKDACTPALPEQHRLSDARLAATLFYFPDAPMQGDVDNIVKNTLDGMTRHVYFDDGQIERVVVQKFEPGSVYTFNDPSAALLEALEGERPILYVRLSTDIYGDLP
jgi:crossover junction endodeoxyribonuclease RusA